MPIDAQPLSEPAPTRGWAVWLPQALGAVLMQGAFGAVQFILPIIARREFEASTWDTTAVTAAPSVLAVVSIFWGALLPRLGVGRYLLVVWGLSALALAAGTLIGSITHLAAVAVLFAIAFAGWWPLSGHLLGLLYPQAVRGRAFAWITVAATLFGAGASWLVGESMARDDQAFRVFMPAAALLQLGAIAIVALACRRANALARAPRQDTPTSLRSLLQPVAHMGSVLAQDKVFARYEGAFMTYGVGWMITFALLPLLATDRLNLPYDAYSTSWYVVSQLVVVLITPFAGLLMDRWGAVRVCTVAFGCYALWPILLEFAGDAVGLAASSVVFGLCAGAVNMGWMLGPVALAPSPDKASQYVAIHATLVGFRGIVFQFAGVALYNATGSFTAPLVIAAAGFLWAAWQMRRLHRLMKAQDHPMTR